MVAIDYAVLDSAIEAHFELLRARVTGRIRNPERTAWLFGGRSLAWMPDYLAFGAVGRKPAEQLLNRTFSSVLPAIWHRTLWAKIRRRVLEFGANSYFPKILADMPKSAELEGVRIHVLAAMHRVLERNWADLRGCTFYEAFNCLAGIMNEPRVLAGFPLDAFAADKTRQNRRGLALVPMARRLVANSGDPLATLLRLACRANWIDSMEDNVETAEQEIEDEVSGTRHPAWLAAPDSRFFRIGACRDLLAGPARAILYEFDNCGEVAIDLLLIEALLERGHRIFACVRELPVANDVTAADLRNVLDADAFSALRAAEADGRLRIVSSGPFAAGRLLSEAAEGYRMAWREAQLLILKGQGNFQTMPLGFRRSGSFVAYPYDKPIILMMGVKAELARLALGSIFRDPPPLGSAFVYRFDPADKATWPA